MALVRDMAGASDVAAMTREARALVRELDGPQSDRDWAKALTEQEFPEAASANEHALWRMAELGIAKGRELERTQQKDDME